jgi:hypothetical protein
MRIYIIGNDGITLCREPGRSQWGRNYRRIERGIARGRAQRQAAAGAVERPARYRKAPESRRPRSAARSAVVGDRGITGA